MLSIFTIPKYFRGHFGVIQTNAIKSWLSFRPACEVILFGKDEGTSEIASELGIKHIPDIQCNEFGTPLVSDAFNITQNIGSHRLMCYVNSDIILMNDFLAAVRRIHKDSFLLIGQRWDLNLERLYDFSHPDWEKQLRDCILKEGKLHPPTGIDYFVFPRGQYRDMPPLAVGRPGWDNWMIYRTRLAKIPVIDGTKSITAIHQNHDYSHHPEKEKGVWTGPERDRNVELMGGTKHAFNIKHATYILTPQSVKRALSIEHLCYRISAIPKLIPSLRFLDFPMSLPRRGLTVWKKLMKSIFDR